MQRSTGNSHAPSTSETTSWGRRLRGLAGLTVSLLVAGGILLISPVTAGASVSADEQWISRVTGRSNVPATLAFGDSGVTATISATRSRCGATSNEDSYASLSSRDAQNYFSPQAPTTAVAVVECLGAGTSGNRVVALNKPVAGLMMHINNLDASYIDFDQIGSGGYLVERVKSNATLQVQENGTRIRNTVNQGTASCTDDATSTNNPGCGSFRLSQNGGPVSTFSFTNFHAISGNDGWFWSLSFHKAALTKTFTPTAISLGGTSALAITITNPNTEGALDLAGAGYTDTLPAGLTLADGAATTSGCGPAVVNAGEAAAGQGAVTVSNATIAAGTSCVVTVNVTAGTTAGTYVNNNANITTTLGNVVPQANATLTVSARSELSLVKHAAAPADVNGNGIADAGDTILYTFDVSNTGQTSLTNVAVDDPKAGAVSCPTTTLAVGASTTCSAAKYTITSADVANGSVDNTATASGTGPQATPVTSLPSTTMTPAAAPAPAITLVKATETPAQPASAPGDVVDYTFTVSNTGNVPLSKVGVTEGTFTGSGSLSSITCPSDTLSVGQQLVCTAEYSLTQADVDAGAVTNTATAQGTAIGADSPTVSSPSEATVTVADAAGITVAKSADVTNITAAGNEITYSFLVTNTGNVTLSDVSVMDSDFTGTGSLSAVTCPPGALAPGSDITCTATYTATQADLDAGGAVSNSATAQGSTPSGKPVTSTRSTTQLTVAQAPALALKKTADVTAVAVGQTITYSFLVTNTGNVTLTRPTVSEGRFSGSGELSAVTCPTDARLAPGDKVTCTATYKVTPTDSQNGPLTNTATASAMTPRGETVPASSPSTSTVTTVRSPAAPPAPTSPGADPAVGHETSMPPASLAKTGSSSSGVISVAAIVLLLLGGGLQMTRRRAAR